MNTEFLLVGAGAAGAAWFFRKVLVAPWAVYVRHSTVPIKNGVDSAFLSVRRVRWYPPFLSYEETWHSNSRGYFGDRKWFRESDGMEGGGEGDIWFARNASLSAIYASAVARDLETQELSK